jgi:transposase-like protein
VADGLSARFPLLSELLLDGQTDLLVLFTFPEAHRRKIRSTNPLKRLNKASERRTAVLGIFPTRASVLRLVRMVLAEQHDEWRDDRHYFRPESMALLDAVPHEDVPALLMAS